MSDHPNAGPDSIPTPGSDAPPPREETRTKRMIDVQGMIKQASTRVSVNQLVQQGKKYISLLSKERIEELINQSVKNIVDKYRAAAAGISGMPIDKIEAEAKGEFNELLQEYQRSAKAKSELHQTKESMDEELDELRKALAMQRSLTDGKLNEELEKAFILGFKDFERELDKVITRTFDKRKVILEASGSPEAVAELKQVEDVLRPVIAKLVSIERQRFAALGESKVIALLEKRIEKLYAQIAQMEKALSTISNSKLFSNQQIQNILRQLGLAQEDRNYEKKREMLKVVLMANQEFKKGFKQLEDKGITLANPKGVDEVDQAVSIASAPPKKAPSTAPAPSGPPVFR